MGKTTFKKDEKNATLTVERTFDAAGERVWRFMTDPVLLDQWWAPKPWKTETLHMDLRVGGYWHYSMNGPEGERHFGRMNFIEIDPPRRYKALDVFADESGATDDSLPEQTFETTLIDEDGGTKVVIVVTYGSLEDLDKILAMGMQEGLAMAQDQLEALLAEG
jgi:PhnB protein